MRTPVWKDEQVRQAHNLTFVLSFENECDLDPRVHFIDECGWTNEAYEEIKNFYWFTAKVTAYYMTKTGPVEYGNAYLGGCCYRSKSEVMGDSTAPSILSGYLPQMIDEARDEAENSLPILEGV